MAHSKHLTAARAAELKKHLGELLAKPNVGPGSNAQPKLAESFEILLLDPSHLIAASTAGVGVDKFLRRSSQWHHQILMGDGTYMIGRSTEPHSAKEPWTVQGVFASPLAAAIAKAVELIDRERPDDDTDVRLVFAPSYQLHAFLLKNPKHSEVLVIDSPTSPVLKAGEFYSEKDFLERLKQVPVTKGLTAGTAEKATEVKGAPPLNPHALQIIPSSVDLPPANVQQFRVLGPGDAARNVSWLLSPGIGTISDDGLYTPDPSVTEITHLQVVAINAHLNQTVSAKVMLRPPPMPNWKRNALGIYVVAVFSLVFLLVDLWPLSPPDPALVTTRQDAQKAVDSDAKAIAALQATLSKQAAGKAPDDSLAKQIADAQEKQTEDTKTLGTATAAERASTASSEGAGMFADRLGVTLPREIDLLFLVLIAGAIGAFMHSARSFTGFAGNSSLRSSWMWWYYLHPFLGAALALALYLTVRAGFLVIATGAVKTSDLNPFAVVSLSVLAGMFSKAATTKLGEIFDVIFQSSNPSSSQNPVQTSPQQGDAGSPAVTAVSPSSGSAAGGTQLTITGANFVSGAKVIIGGFPATSVTWTSNTTLAAVSPHHAPGATDVEVINPDMRKGVLPRGFQYL